MVLLLLRSWRPPDDPAYVLCFTRRVLGLACPGCGLTRAIAYLLRGDPVTALSLHPLVPLAAADLVAAAALWGLSAHGLIKPPPATLVMTVILFQVALFLALWLGRLATGTLPL